MNNEFARLNGSPQADSVCYILSEDALRKIVREMCAEERQRVERAVAEHREQPTISRREAARMLNVTTSTLWRWANDGYLVPVKIGSKVLYRATDIDRMLARKMEGGAL